MKQDSLFNPLPATDDYRDHDLGDAWIREFPQAFEKPAAANFLASLSESIPWRQDTIRIAGKHILVPRLQCWMGDERAIYGYSGIKLNPEPWSADVLDIRNRVQRLTGHEFNAVLINYYRDGNDSVSWHADDERELGSNPVIASVSLGVERSLQLKHKHRSETTRRQVNMPSGSVLLFSKNMQNNWLHQLPKSKTISEPRLNLTFRKIIVA